MQNIENEVFPWNFNGIWWTNGGVCNLVYSIMSWQKHFQYQMILVKTIFLPLIDLI